ncbi:MAG: transposase [Rhodocyclaceae bacterium]|nr:transposase [Rhodocyclaceae bacterium]
MLHSFLRCIEQGLLQGIVESDGKARIGAVVFIHRFGTLINAHLHFHAIAIDGAAFGEDAETLRREEVHPTREAMQRRQATIDQRIVRLFFVRCGLLHRRMAKPYVAANAAAASSSVRFARRRQGRLGPP